MRHRGAQPGNRNGARTGIYSRPLQPSELRRLDDLVEELRDALGSSYSVRFEAALVVLAGQIWRWQKGMSYLLRRDDVGHENASVLQALNTLENSMRLTFGRLGLDTESALSMKLKVDHHRPVDLDASRLDAKERRTLERLVSKMESGGG